MDGGKNLIVSFGDDIVGAVGSNIANSIEAEHNNLTTPFTSNQQIHRNIVNYLSTESTKHKTFLIGWSHPKRRFQSWEGQEYTYAPERTDFPTNAINRLHDYDSLLFDPVLSNELFATTAFAVQSLLQSRKINYYMFNTWACIDYSGNVKKLCKNLDHRFYHNPISQDSTMVSYITKNGYTFGLHNQTSDDALELWSKFILQKFRAVGLYKK